MASYPLLSSRPKAAYYSAVAMVLIPFVYLVLDSTIPGRIVRVPIIVLLVLSFGTAFRLLIDPKELMLVSSSGIYIGRTQLDWPQIRWLEIRSNRAGRYLYVMTDPAQTGGAAYQVSERLSSVRIPDLIVIIQTYHDVEVVFC